MTVHRPRSLYDVLNVSIEAEPVVIEAAYRALMKKYHPDQAVGGAMSRNVVEINAAYAVLRDPARRAEYDHKEWMRQQSAIIANVPALIPRRRSRATRVGGWALAVVIGCGVGLSLAGSISIATPPQRGGARVAAAPSAPPDAELRSPEEQVAEFLAAHARPQSAEEVLQPVRAETELDAIEPVEQPRAGAGGARPRGERVRRERSAGTVARKAADEEFLEREGFIY